MTVFIKVAAPVAIVIGLAIYASMYKQYNDIISGNRVMTEL